MNIFKKPLPFKFTTLVSVFVSILFALIILQPTRGSGEYAELGEFAISSSLFFLAVLVTLIMWFIAVIFFKSGRWSLEQMLNRAEPSCKKSLILALIGFLVLIILRILSSFLSVSGIDEYPISWAIYRSICLGIGLGFVFLVYYIISRITAHFKHQELNIFRTSFFVSFSAILNVFSLALLIGSMILLYNAFLGQRHYNGSLCQLKQINFSTILNYNSPKNFEYSCITEKAAKNKDFKICHQTPLGPGSYFLRICYERVASVTGSTIPCKFINPTESPNGEFETCLSGALGSIQKSGARFQSPDQCFHLDDSDDSNFCYLETAVVQKGPAICEIINESRLKEFCYFRIATEDPPDIELCLKSGFYKSKCYFYSAVSTTNVAICEFVDKILNYPYTFDPLTKEDCVFNVLYDLWAKDPRNFSDSECNRIKNGFLKDYCYDSVRKLKEEM